MMINRVLVAAFIYTQVILPPVMTASREN